MYFLRTINDSEVIVKNNGSTAIFKLGNYDNLLILFVVYFISSLFILIWSGIIS